jgi:hypothetical protein
MPNLVVPCVLLMPRFTRVVPCVVSCGRLGAGQGYEKICQCSCAVQPPVERQCMSMHTSAALLGTVAARRPECMLVGSIQWPNVYHGLDSSLLFLL